MISATAVMGIIGIILFVIILGTFKKLLENNEGGFLHLLMSLMFICWLPIPFVVFLKLRSYTFLFVGAMLGTLSLIIFIITMIIQASHLSYSAKLSMKDNEDRNKTDQWIINGLIGSQVELLAGFLKGIWVIFLTVAFWLDGQILFALLGTIYSLFTIGYLFMLLDTSLIKEVKFLKKFKLNTLIINLENASWFLILIVWLILH